MKFLISIVLTAILSVAACLYLPWYSIAIVAFIVSAVVQQKPLASFLAGFIPLFLLWGGLSWYISSNNNDLLAHKISLLILKADSPMLLILITALIGALVGGLAALSGSFVRRLNDAKPIAGESNAIPQ
ncbi:MAG: hypothetical protein V4685_04140 [Bacteroidota bacterium]